MEAEVGVDEAVGEAGLGERRGHLLGRRVHLGQVLGHLSLCGESSSLALENPAQLEQVVDAGSLVEGEEHAQRAVERIHRLGDDERAPALRADHSLRLEHPQRLPHRRAPDGEAFGELTFGRERVARAQRTLADHVDEPLRDELVRLAPGDRLGGDGVGNGVCHRVCYPCALAAPPVARVSGLPPR